MLKSNAKISLILVLLFTVACGVKSDPLPPESPIEMSNKSKEQKVPKKQQKDEDSEEND